MSRFASRFALITALCSIALLPLLSTSVTGQEAEPSLTAEALVERYLEARGGADTWRAIKSLEARGTYAAFSEESSFTLLRKEGDLFRLEYRLLDAPTIRARDKDGPWMQHPFLTPTPRRATEGPYKVQLERESLFGLELLDWQDKGLKLELLGPGEVDGIPTIDLAVTLLDGTTETWHFDPETYLEIAVDTEVNDFTQGQQRMLQRTFFDDFRKVEGLVFPHTLEIEFWARLETMRIDSVTVNGEIGEERFSPPPIPEADAVTESSDS